MTIRRDSGTLEDALVKMAGHPDIGWSLMSVEADWSEDMLRKASNPNHEPRIDIGFRRAMRLDRLWMRATGGAPILMGVYLDFLEREDRFGRLDPDMAIHAISKEFSEVMQEWIGGQSPMSPGGAERTLEEKRAARKELQDLYERTADAIAALDASIVMHPRRAG